MQKQITVAEILEELKVILGDEYNGEITETENGLAIAFENGQTFIVSVKEQ